MGNFIRLHENKVLVTMHGDASLEYLYDLLLQDIVETLDKYPSKHPGSKQYGLCPRWSKGNLEERKIHMTLKNGFHTHSFGSIHIKPFEIPNTLPNPTTFELSFNPSPGKRFVTPQEFHDLYNSVQ